MQIKVLSRDKCHRGVGVTSKLIKRAFGNEENRNFSSPGSTLGYYRLFLEQLGEKWSERAISYFLGKVTIGFSAEFAFSSRQKFSSARSRRLN